MGVSGFITSLRFTSPRNWYHFFRANQQKAKIKFYSWTKNDLFVNRCDWRIFAGSWKRIVWDCLDRHKLIFLRVGILGTNNWQISIINLTCFFFADDLRHSQITFIKNASSEVTFILVFCHTSFKMWNSPAQKIRNLLHRCLVNATPQISEFFANFKIWQICQICWHFHWCEMFIIYCMFTSRQKISIYSMFANYWKFTIC